QPSAPEWLARFRYYRNAQKCTQGGVLALPYRWQYRVDRWKQAFGGMFGGGEKRPQLCPGCGALVGIHATRCHECGTNLRFGLAAWSKGLAEFFGGLSILWGMNGETLFRLGACYPPSIYQGHEWYRLITAMFLHGGLIHIGF